MQNYMTGEESGGDPNKFPYAAPAVAWPALRRIEAILASARPVGAPVIYTCFAIDTRPAMPACSTPRSVRRKARMSISKAPSAVKSSKISRPSPATW